MRVLAAWGQFVGWALVMVVLAVLGWFDWAFGWGWAVLGLWGGVLLGSRWRCLRVGGGVSLVREVDGVQVVGRSFEVGLVVRNEGGRRVQVAIFEHLEAGLVAKGLPLVVNLQAGEVRRLGYEVCGQQRGRWAILGAQVRYGWRWGLWVREVFLEEVQVVRVFSRLTGSAARALSRARAQQLAVGNRLRARGGEFRQLREFEWGDGLHALDYRASLRLGRWLAREFEQEEQQRVVWVVDGSQAMLARYGEVGVLDEVLAMVAELARLGLSSGDAVGLYGFAAGLQVAVGASDGMGQYERILAGVLDIGADEVRDYQEIGQVLRQEGQQALVVVVTMLALADVERLEQEVRRLAVRHRVVVVNVCPPFFQALEAVSDVADALRCGARDAYVNAFALWEARLRDVGVRFVSVQASEVGSALVGCYWGGGY